MREGAEFRASEVHRKRCGCWNTLQADALKLMAKGLQNPLAVEGELPKNGLAALGDDGDDLMLALARQIVSGKETDGESVEQVFAQARDAEAASEKFLVDEGWKRVEAEAAPVVEVHADGSNGHGHVVPPIGDYDYHEETAEGQQSLFSWAEFLAEEPAQIQDAAASPRPRPCSSPSGSWATSNRGTTSWWQRAAGR